jgi:PTS system D-glucosamine-specific IIC component
MENDDPRAADIYDTMGTYFGYAIAYYFIFRYLILKFDLKTPGRDTDNDEVRLYTRKDMNERKKSNNDTTSAYILKGLGGRDNISDIDACATRLRITVKNSSVVDDELLKKSGASGVIHKGNGVQIIYGPHVSVVKSQFEDYLDSGMADIIDSVEMNEPDKNIPDPQRITAEKLTSHMNGTIVPLDRVADEVFSKGILGFGVAVEPSEGRLYSPCDGVVESVFDTGHAINLKSDGGLEILLHIGIDTVQFKGKYFSPQVKDGQKVKKGDLLITFDREEIMKHKYKVTTPLIICNSDLCGNINVVADKKINVGDIIIETE